MSYITIDNVKPYVKPSIYSALTSEVTDNVTNFDLLNPQVDYMINSRFGIDIPANAEIAKYHYPASLFLQRIAKNLLTDLTEDFNAEIEKDFVFASELLNQMQSIAGVEPVDTSKSIIGEITGVEEW